MKYEQNRAMKKTYLLICLALFYTQCILAQENQITGVVQDTLQKQNLHLATASLLASKDSVLLTFVRTNTKGEFVLKNLVPGNYILLVTYPGYADYAENLTINSNEKNTLLKISLLTQARILEDVIVKQKVSAIKIKGDTTEFKADSFKVNANANVQELLKKLPGFTVNSKGEITAQGQKIEKVLVDGEEFFSDDPAVVTQNLRADVLDKVQLFDKKSDQAAFTGIDDGQKTKTLNLQLKEDKKKGYFGKLEGGSNFDNYHNGKAMVNAFKGKKKIAAYVTGDNTRAEALDWNERTNFGEDLDRTTEVNADGGVSIWSSGDEFTSNQGLPTAYTAGAHFSNKWNQDKNTTANTYQFNRLDVRGTNQSFLKTILPDTSFTNINTETFNSQRQRHRGRTVFDWNIDSTSQLKATINVSNVQTNSSTSNSGESRTEEDALLNQSIRSLTNFSNITNAKASVFWRKRFAKKGRTISVNTDLEYITRNGNGMLKANNSFFTNGQPSSTLLIDQAKNQTERENGVSIKAVYTEPVWKNVFLELNYKLAIRNNDAERNTLEKPAGTDKYSQLVDTLSNHFIFNTTGHTAGTSLRYQNKKLNTTIGLAIGNMAFDQNNLRNSTQRTLHFINYLPQASIQYSFKKQTNLNLSYNGNTQNPTIQQIQPIIDNIDPLNLQIGNPNLKQEFRHNIRLSFNDYKILKSRGIYMGGGFTFVDNAISNASFIDDKGRRLNQAINVNGNYNGYIWASVNREFNGVNVSLNLNPSINRFNNIVNGLANQSDNLSLGIGPSFGYWKDKPVNFWVNMEANYNWSRSSLRPTQSVQYWSFTSYPSVEVKLPKKWYWNVSGEIMLYQQTELFSARNVSLINSSIKKSIGKAESWQVKLSVSDLLNNNQGIERNINTNFISENVRQTIRRVVLVSVVYNFTKNGKPNGNF